MPEWVFENFATSGSIKDLRCSKEKDTVADIYGLMKTILQGGKTVPYGLNTFQDTMRGQSTELQSITIKTTECLSLKF